MGEVVLRDVTRGTGVEVRLVDGVLSLRIILTANNSWIKQCLCNEYSRD